MFTKLKNKLKVNWLKTIIFNFKMLPFKQALHLPILLYGRVDISGCTGNVIINADKIYHAMAFIGSVVYYFGKSGLNSNKTLITIKGTLKLGKYCRINNGSAVFVDINALFEMGDYATIGVKSEIYCTKHISIEPYVLTAWNCQIFDTNFHYYAQNHTNVSRINKEVFIGNNCWIGNNATIARGARLGAFCIVASKSLVNKDYSNIVGGLFAGSPAKLCKENVCRIVNLQQERRLHYYFSTHDDDTYSLPSWDDSFIRF